MTVTVVVPTVGRPSLRGLLDSLAASEGPLPAAILLVDDRPQPTHPLLETPPERLTGLVEILTGAAAGPAAARNVGWRAATSEWIAFLDDDVVVEPDWLACLAADLQVDGGVAGTQGRINVPLPSYRRPTDWERNIAGLELAQWATADLAYRRSALVAVGGFDERFVRAYREDADLGARITARGWRVVRGRRRILHPVRPAGRWVSVTLQRGNADDALLRARYGPHWREVTGVPPGRRRRHLLTSAALIGGFATLAAGRRRAATALLTSWVALTSVFAHERIAPGPRTPAEVATMAVTSAAIPPAAVWHWLRGWLDVLRRGAAPPQISAVLFDRDGTLITDVAYNGDPSQVRPREGAREALRMLREAGVPTAMVSNQSGIARGLLTRSQVDAVNDRVEQLLGPVGPWSICPHGPADGCGCRKPRPGLIHDAARQLGVDVRRCVVIGDIGSDVDAAHAAGARAVLVPTEVTRAEEVAAAPVVASDLAQAVELALGLLTRSGDDREPSMGTRRNPAISARRTSLTSSSDSGRSPA